MDTPADDVSVTSWTELVAALRDDAFMLPPELCGRHVRSKFVFRGMSDASWPLRTSLERLGSPPERVERPLLRNFRKYSPPQAFQHDSPWEILALAQHNGLPTRCLDWTTSPLVAAHFATVEPQHRQADGVIWAIDAVAWRDALLPDFLLDLMRREGAGLFDIPILARRFKDLAELDDAGLTPPGLFLLLEPPSIDSRIANQAGVLSVVSAGTGGHQAWVDHVRAHHPGVVRRLVIDARAKGEIRDMLDHNNLNERMLFPGLPGLCEWLRRYYSPA